MKVVEDSYMNVISDEGLINDYELFLGMYNVSQIENLHEYSMKRALIFELLLLQS
jgi:hypothetical protein